MGAEKRTQKFIKGLASAKESAAQDGIELTPEEASKMAMKKALKPKKSGTSKKRKGSPFLPGSFESSSR